MSEPTLNAFAEIQPGSACRAASRARRADRLPAMIGLQLEANAVLDELRVLIIGIGSIGATVAESLARLRVGELRLVDRGRFTEFSLHTQPISGPEVGQPKARTIARRCKQISPGSRVLAFDGPIQALPLAEMAGTQVVILAGDNANVTYATGERCLNLGLPLVYASVHGDSLTAQCRVFAGRDPQGPCPVCLFGDDEFRMLEAERNWSCEGFRDPVAQAADKSTQVTMSLRPLCALAGDVAALTALRLALQLGPSLTNTFTEINAYTWRTFVTPLRRNPACPCHHQRFATQHTSRTLSRSTLRELLRTARREGDKNRELTAVTVEGYSWVERGLCRCPEPKTVNRFVPARQLALFRCPRCRQRVHAQPFYTHDAVSVRLLDGALDRPLRALGAADARGVCIHRDDQTTLLMNPQRPNRKAP